MRPSGLLIVPLLVLSAPLSAAQEKAKASETDKPVTQSEPDVVDVATTPANDLNLRKDEIPAILLAAQEKPYDLAGLSRCRALVQAVHAFDAVLGPDIDLPQEERGRISAGRVAQSVVGSFIPFRGILREVSGANEQQRRMREAVQAGFARRGFLKGIGRERGCNHPARPAPARLVAQEKARLEKAEERKK